MEIKRRKTGHGIRKYANIHFQNTVSQKDTDMQVVRRSDLNSTLLYF